MLCIKSENNEPFFNLAAEEYFLKQSSADIFMLWLSKSVVVCGKHQNILSEINYRYTKETGIHVARRLTGGGTVFHDPGNLNFSFIRNGEPGKLVDFAAFIKPVIGFLKTKGIEAVQGSKHEILVKDRKISGNAEHVYKSRVLHHGTLLFNADLNRLKQSIAHHGSIYTDKAVRSNRSNVLNLIECLPASVTLKSFSEELFDFIMRSDSGSVYHPDEADIKSIDEIATQKYRTWEWTYGWSPDYDFRNTWQGMTNDLVIEFSTHRGLITSSTITSLTLEDEIIAKLNRLLSGSAHKEEQISKALIQSGVSQKIQTGEMKELVYAFF